MELVCNDGMENRCACEIADGRWRIADGQWLMVEGRRFPWFPNSAWEPAVEKLLLRVQRCGNFSAALPNLYRPSLDSSDLLAPTVTVAA